MEIYITQYYATHLYYKQTDRQYHANSIFAAVRWAKKHAFKCFLKVT